MSEPLLWVCYKIDLGYLVREINAAFDRLQNGELAGIQPVCVFKNCRAVYWAFDTHPDNCDIITWPDSSC